MWHTTGSRTGVGAPRVVLSAADVGARRAFRRYWRLVGPFSALIRRLWLAEIRRAIDQVCDEQALILGPAVERFERNLADYCQTRHAIGVSSGTDAVLRSTPTAFTASSTTASRLRANVPGETSC